MLHLLLLVLKISIKLISIPRDTAAYIDGEKNRYKINYAFAKGKEQLALKTINKTFDLSLKEYVTINISAMYEIINELGVKPEECLFIGDSGMDMAVSKNAGCVGVGVLWGFREEDELRQNGADYIVSKPNEILSVLKEISNEK